jgi:hypothetical protein
VLSTWNVPTQLPLPRLLQIVVGEATISALKVAGLALTVYCVVPESNPEPLICTRVPPVPTLGVSVTDWAATGPTDETRIRNAEAKRIIIQTELRRRFFTILHVSSDCYLDRKLP